MIVNATKVVPTFSANSTLYYINIEVTVVLGYIPQITLPQSILAPVSIFSSTSKSSATKAKTAGRRLMDIDADEALSPVGEIRIDMLTTLSDKLSHSLNGIQGSVSLLSELLGVNVGEIDPESLILEAPDWNGVAARAQRSLLQTSLSNSSNQSACGPGPAISNLTSSNSSAFGITSASNPSTTCLTSLPATATVLLASIMGILDNLTQSGSSLSSSLSSLSTIVGGLGDKFDTTDNNYAAAYQEMINLASSGYSNVSQELNVLIQLVETTLAAQSLVAQLEASVIKTLVDAILDANQAMLDLKVIDGIVVGYGLDTSNVTALTPDEAQYLNCLYGASKDQFFRFTVDSFANVTGNSTSGNTTRRELSVLGHNLGSNILQQTNLSTVSWNSYVIFPADSQIAYNMELSQTTDRKRCVDPVCANTLLGGLMIHTVRRSIFDVQYVSGGSNVFNAATEQACGKDRFSNLIAACVKVKGFGQSSMPPDLSPYGQDPVLNSQSSIYNSGVQASDYYNSSDSFQMNLNTGIPYGFQHYPLKGQSMLP